MGTFLWVTVPRLSLLGTAVSPSLEALSRRGCTSSPRLENVLVACFVSLPPSFMSWKEVTRWLCGGPLDHLAAALTSVSCVNGEKVLLMETAQRSRVSALVTFALLFTPFFLLCKQTFHEHILFTRVNIRYVREPGWRQEAGKSLAVL